MKKNIREVAFYVLAAMVLVLMAYVTVSVLSKPIPVENQRASDIMLGIVLGWGGLVVGYFFGSSKGSADKTEAMAEKKDNPTQG